MRNLVSPTLIAMLFAVGGCATTGQTPEGAVDPGCYYFDQQSQGARELRLPWGVRLMEQPLEGWPALAALEGVRTATTLTGTAEQNHPFGYWRPMEADTLLVGYPGGGGVSLHLVPSEDGLEGIARPLGDATLAAERPRYAVRLTRARCPEDL